MVQDFVRSPSRRKRRLFPDSQNYSDEKLVLQVVQNGFYF